MRHFLLLTLAGALSANAMAATPINQTHPLAVDGTVSIDNLKGRISVRTWDRPEVALSGSLGAGVEALKVEGDSNKLSIVVRYPKHGGNWFGGDKAEPTLLEVNVPVGASLNIESVSADISIADSKGRRLSMESVSGDVLITNSQPGAVNSETVSGDQDLNVATSEVDASSVSGNIRLQGRITGDVSVETVSGDVRIGTARLDQLDAGSVSGDLHIATSLSANAEISAETLSGDLNLNLPSATSAELTVETFSGDIRSPVGTVESAEFGNGHSLNAQMGAGDAEIDLESFSGEVVISLR